MADEPKKFAQVTGDPARRWSTLMVGGVEVRSVVQPQVSGFSPSHTDMEIWADKINAAFEAEVERRLDEITRRAAV